MSKGYYDVLRPIYHGTGTYFTTIDAKTGRMVKREWYEVEWQLRGAALSMEDAKQKFGGSPVLQWVPA